MKGDFSTLRFDPRKRFSKVLHQQGRVMTDADLNEAAFIDAYFDEIERIDVIGETGVPAHHDGFEIVDANGNSEFSDKQWKELRLTRGRCYISGKIVDADDESDDLFLSKWSLEPEPGKGQYWVVLEARERYVSPAEDPDIVEEALQGPDTAGRTRVEGRIKLRPAGDGPHDHCPDRETFGDNFLELPTMSAITPIVNGESDPCETPNEGGYQGLENQFYRFEVHTGSHLPDGSVNPDGPTIKWSRDNANHLSRVVRFVAENELISVAKPGRDNKSGFQAAKFVEALAPNDLRWSVAGEITAVTTVTGTETINVTGASSSFKSKVAPDVAEGEVKRVVYLRAWHGYETGVSTGDSFKIENDLSVKFEFDKGAPLRAGDYWLVPARAVSGSVIWPKDDETAKQLPPFEIGSLSISDDPRIGDELSHIVLGLLDRKEAGWTRLMDCRKIFFPLTEQDRLVYVSGDGQEYGPLGEIDAPLIVGVVNGIYAVEDANIRWSTSIDGDPYIVFDPERPTSIDGTSEFTTAEAHSVVISEGGSLSKNVSVMAELLGDDDEPIQTPIIFRLNPSLAKEVMYAPTAVDCTRYPGVDNVHDALDKLCKIAADSVDYVPPDDCDRFKNKVDVQAALDALCTIDAEDVVYDSGCAPLADMKTVKQALDKLCSMTSSEGCCLVIDPGGDNLAKALKVIIGDLKTPGACLCLKPGIHIWPEEAVELFKKRAKSEKAFSLSMHGISAATKIVSQKGPIELVGMASLEVRDLSIFASGVEHAVLIDDCDDVVVQGCDISGSVEATTVTFSRDRSVSTVSRATATRRTRSAGTAPRGGAGTRLTGITAGTRPTTVSGITRIADLALLTNVTGITAVTGSPTARPGDRTTSGATLQTSGAILRIGTVGNLTIERNVIHGELTGTTGSTRIRRRGETVWDGMSDLKSTDARTAEFQNFLRPFFAASHTERKNQAAQLRARLNEFGTVDEKITVAVARTGKVLETRAFDDKAFVKTLKVLVPLWKTLVSRPPSNPVALQLENAIGVHRVVHNFLDGIVALYGTTWVDAFTSTLFKAFAISMRPGGNSVVKYRAWGDARLFFSDNVLDGFKLPASMLLNRTFIGKFFDGEGDPAFPVYQVASLDGNVFRVGMIEFFAAHTTVTGSMFANDSTVDNLLACRAATASSNIADSTETQVSVLSLAGFKEAANVNVTFS